MIELRKPYKLSEAQILLGKHMQELGYKCVYEYTFETSRRWRIDVYCDDLRLGIECNGGRWFRGHRSSRDTDKDNEKMNTAQMMGIRILQFTNEFVLDGRAKEFVREWL
jgi:very-short-patch-repair endonuclease